MSNEDSNIEEQNVSQMKIEKESKYSSEQRRHKSVVQYKRPITRTTIVGLREICTDRAAAEVAEWVDDGNVEDEDEITVGKTVRELENPEDEAVTVLLPVKDDAGLIAVAVDENELLIVDVETTGFDEGLKTDEGTARVEVSLATGDAELPDMEARVKSAEYWI